MRTRGTIGVVLFAVVTVLLAASVASARVSATQAALTVQVIDDVGGFARFGSTVTFTYTVTNTGDETVTAISVDDSLAGHVGDVAQLSPGGSVSLSAPVVIEGPAAGGVGTCSALGAALQGPVSASTDYGVEVFMADNVTDFAVMKQALAQTAAPEELVRYRLRVRVAEPGIATGVALVDDYDEKAMTPVDVDRGRAADGRITWRVPDDLREGESFGVECSFRLKTSARGVVSNVALLDAEDPDPNVSNDRSETAIRVLSDADAGPGDPAADPAAATRRARAGEPFLPFTGPPDQLVSLFWLFGGLGYALRRFSS